MIGAKKASVVLVLLGWLLGTHDASGLSFQIWYTPSPKGIEGTCWRSGAERSGADRADRRIGG